MPREFIAAVEDANNEIIRLDTRVEELTRELQVAQDGLTSMEAKFTEEQRLRVGVEEQMVALRAEGVTKDTRITTLSAEVDAQKLLVTKACAAAGVSPKADEASKTGMTDKEGADKGSTSNEVTGIARAIRANQALQTK
jgi:hypothetical protein